MFLPQKFLSYVVLPPSELQAHLQTGRLSEVGIMLFDCYLLCWFDWSFVFLLCSPDWYEIHHWSKLAGLLDLPASMLHTITLGVVFCLGCFVSCRGLSVLFSYGAED